MRIDMKFAFATATALGGMYWFARDVQRRLRRARGGVSALIRAGDAGDIVIAARIRAALARETPRPWAIVIACSDGVVALTGAVLKHEHARVMRAARSAAGVSEVHDELAVFKGADGVSVLDDTHVVVGTDRTTLRFL
jgi:osmotically-inducible protein OsmY